MSPFSEVLSGIRKSRRMRQTEFAEAMGYEQSYISALENGLKGPPTKDFILKMFSALSLDEKEKSQVTLAVSMSSKKFLLPAGASHSFYEFCYELSQRAQYLRPSQIEILTNVLRLMKEVD